MWPLWFVILSEFKIEQSLEYDMTYAAPLMPVGEPNVLLVLFFWAGKIIGSGPRWFFKLNLAQVGERKKEAFQEIRFFCPLFFVHSLFAGVKRGETKSLFIVVDHDRVLHCPKDEMNDAFLLALCFLFATQRICRTIVVNMWKRAP